MRHVGDRAGDPRADRDHVGGDLGVVGPLAAGGGEVVGRDAAEREHGDDPQNDEGTAPACAAAPRSPRGPTRSVDRRLAGARRLGAPLIPSGFHGAHISTCTSGLGPRAAVGLFRNSTSGRMNKKAMPASKNIRSKASTVA